jgi:hypothetical protein
MNDYIMDDLAKYSNSEKNKATNDFFVDDTFKEVFINSKYDESSFLGKFLHFG